MARVEVEVEQGDESAGPAFAEEGSAPRQERKQQKKSADATAVEIEKEVTKRQLIQAVSSLAVVILYMLFALLRDRDSGVVVMDGDEGPSGDWQE